MAWEGSTRRARLPADWPQRVAAVKRRDRGICYVCGEPGADQVDHIRRGDDHSLGNLGSIHDDPCHRAKTAREAAEARAARPRRQRPSEPHPGLTKP